MVGTDLNAIRHALTLARAKGYDEVELIFNGVEFQARLKATPAPAASSSGLVDAARGGDKSPSEWEITAPVVGYYRSNGKPLEIGRQVGKGEAVAFVSGLGLDNDVQAPAAGEVAEVLVKEGQGVEFGQVIARIEVKV